MRQDIISHLFTSLNHHVEKRLAFLAIFIMVAILLFETGWVDQVTTSCQHVHWEVALQETKADEVVDPQSAHICQGLITILIALDTP